jgi:hypothetical protein
VFTVTENDLTSTWVYEGPGGQGRVSTILRSDGRRIEYAYTPTTVTQTISGPSQPTSTVVYNLDGRGLAVSDSLGNTYRYDANGYQTEQKVPSGHYIDQRTIAGGNVTRESRASDTAGTTLMTFTFAYTKLKNLDDGAYFLGKANKNWKRTQTFTDGTRQINFDYEQDSCGRVVTHRLTGGVSGVITYTYY